MDLAYFWYEGARALMAPARIAADLTRYAVQNPANPAAYSPYARSIAAGCEMFERVTRRYGKPRFGLDSTVVDGAPVPVTERVVWERPFCRVISFDRGVLRPPSEPQPKLLIVAPMSGHYATLLRGTVEAMLPNHQVFITDWADARMVPITAGRFVYERANLTAFSIASVPALKKAALVSPEIGASWSSRSDSVT